jgi:DHA3 family macrolide efflux protein-like MFS transporter
MGAWKKNTALFLAGQGVSLLGSSLVQYAIMWHITLTTQSGAMMTISILCGFLPYFFMSPFAGVWADRFDRKKLIMLSDGMIAAVTLIAAVIFICGYSELWLLFAISAVRALGGAVQAPAVGAFLPQLVPQEKLTRVSGINSTLQSSIMLVSPMLGAFLLSVAPVEIIFFIDVVTAAAAIFILLRFLNVPAHKRAGEAKAMGYFSDLKLGVKYINSHGYIKLFFLFGAVFNILVAPVAFLTPLQVTRSFGGEYWQLSAIEIAFSSGMIAGGAVIAAWGGFKNKMYTLMLSCAIFGVCTFAIGVVREFFAYLAFLVVMGVGMPAFNTSSMVFIQEKVKGEYLGRVMGVMSMIVTSMMPLSMLFFGPLSDAVPIETLLVITGPLLAALALAMLGCRTLIRAGRPAEGGRRCGT